MAVAVDNGPVAAWTVNDRAVGNIVAIFDDDDADDDDDDNGFRGTDADADTPNPNGIFDGVSVSKYVTGVLGIVSAVLGT